MIMTTRQITAADKDNGLIKIGPGTFTLQDWDDIVAELRKYWTWD